MLKKLFRPSLIQAAVVLLDQSFCSITNFLTGVLVARACSKAEYGVYVLGFTLLVTAVGIQTSLAGTPFTVLSPPLKSRDRQSYLGSTLIQHLAVSAMASVGFIVAATVVFITGRADGFTGVFFALAITSVFVMLRDFMRYVLLAQLRVWASLLMNLVASISSVGMLFWAYLGDWLTAPAAYLIMAGCSGIPVLFVLLRERKQIIFAKNKLHEHIRNNWSFGKWLIAQVIVVFFAIQIYPWILMIFNGSAATGVYGACVGLAATANPLFMGLNRFFGPRTAHAACNGSLKLHREVYLSMALLAGPLLIIFLVAVFFGEWAIVTVYGKDFAGAGSVFSVCTLTVIITAEGGIINAGLNALRRPDIAFRARLVTLAITITLGLFLVYKLGPLGAASGVCIARIFGVGYQLIKFHSLKMPVDRSDNSIFTRN